MAPAADPANPSAALGYATRFPVRVGIGYDVHPLVAGRPLVLGGVRIEHERGLDGYSEASPGIDHIVVRGATPSPLRVWREDLRRRNGLLLSDHAPVDLEVE